MCDYSQNLNTFSHGLCNLTTTNIKWDGGSFLYKD